MLKIYYTLNSIYRRLYHSRSEQFKSGFEACLHLLDVGMNKHPQFNAYIENERLDKEVEELRKDIKYKDREIRNLKFKLNEQSLVAEGPTNLFKVFKTVALDTKEEFSIIANMTQETFYNMAYNFSMRYSWTNTEEAKAMMLQYINSKSALGFKAYKDEKTALKDKVKIKR